tara:strand:+ start:25 stop:2418 length:2394 start_codon:yes stop_codon:yes gene_type:complete
MATVPLQQTPTEQINTGGTPLFSATNIQPVQDTGVAQDIGRLSNAQKQFAKIAADLQDQHDDIRSNEAYRGYQEEADVKVNEYLSLQRGDAIATVDYDEETNKPITAYDKLVNDLEEISVKYLETLDNKSQKQIFNEKYAASKRISVNSASKHSLKQSRLKLDEESKSNIELSKNAAINSFESWQDPNGDYAINYYRGLLEIKRNAELNGRETDITKGPLSAKYLEDVQAYNKAVMEGVIDKLEKLPGGFALVREYVKAHKPKETKNIVTELEISIAEKHEDYNVEQCVNAILNNKGNQNTGSFLDQTPKLMCLKSNHYVNDGTGASVHDGHHSDKVNIAGQTQENNIDTLEKIKNESKFYKLDSNARLINEHQTTHLFAVQHLGVKKADSLYTKAKSSIEIDTDRYKKDATYTKQINEKIIDNYNKLIIEEAIKLYGGNDRLVGSRYMGKDGQPNEFTTNIANDLEIIKKGINYDGDFTSDVDFITGLRPLEVLKAEIKATITDPKQQKYALQDLEIKYKKISDERTKIYNQALNNAKEIAFAEEGGWKNLEANGIKIEDFSESDQELLKKGQPEESDKDVVIDLERNPVEVATNLPAYSHLLSKSDYLGLKNYANSLNSEAKIIEATGNSDMFDSSLIRFGYTDIVNKVTDDPKAKDQYNFRFDYKQIKDAWLNRIDTEQTNKGKKLTRTEKQELLNEILADGVVTKRWGLFRKSDITIPTVALEADQFKDAFVFVGSERIYVKRIPNDVRQYFIAGYEAAGIPYTEQMIADEWVLHGKKKSKEQIIKFKEENNL